jgi:hypothetical protein
MLLAVRLAAKSADCGCDDHGPHSRSAASFLKLCVPIVRPSLSNRRHVSLYDLALSWGSFVCNALRHTFG